jgi:hypothetical protein
MSDEPKKRSWAWIGLAAFAGLPFLYLLSLVVLLFFVLGVCAAEAIVETFGPQWDNVIWIRFAGGIAALVVLAFGFKLSRHFRKILGSALALFAVSIALRAAAAGTEAASGDPRLNPNLAWLTFLSPLVALAATVWTLVTVWRRIRPNKTHPQ